MDLKYHDLCKVESCGRLGSYGLKILVAIHPPHIEGGPQIELDVPAVLEDEKVRNVVYDVQGMIENVVRAVALSKLPHIAEETKAQRLGLLAGFGSAALLVEEIPNGYCNRYCCAHLPWYVVTTRLGRIKIGWRKSVINIDWAETQGTKTSKELFESEDVTKDTRGIHAWGYEKARAYVGAIITGVSLTPNTK
jgi:hypothetical protein